MSTLPKTRSQRGSSGREDPKPDLEVTVPGGTGLTPEPETPASSNEQSITPDLPASSPDPAPVVGVAAGCVKKPIVAAPLSVTDLKLARKMSKAIAGVLGLSRKSRSVKV